MLSNDRTQIRQFFVNAWQKHSQRADLEPLEQLIVSVIKQHPEYHPLLEAGESLLHQDFTPEAGHTNPFLHMGMHISLQEQISTDRPSGITRIYRQLVRHTGDPHACEHQMMECLAEMLWEVQSAGQPPNEQAYIECLKTRLKG